MIDKILRILSYCVIANGLLCLLFITFIPREDAAIKAWLKDNEVRATSGWRRTSTGRFGSVVRVVTHPDGGPKQEVFFHFEGFRHHVRMGERYD